ncbi:MAG: phosphoglucosamine mutase [Candidatus Hadarchaeum sp.]|uniref:phosphoglucosamine mutase n=1 Tax=Candidatus Hadarchaeum sp. TaxID=2883567 RepID=UPI003D0FBC97
MLGKKLFGTRGIRGPIATKVTPELMLKLGQALAEYVNGGEVVVGLDTRTSGEMLARSFTAGLIYGGSDVIEIGIVPSPCLAFTTRSLGAGAGAIITASHNPPGDNGLALYRSDGTEFLTEDEVSLERIFLSGGSKICEWDELGQVRRYEPITPYLQAIKKLVKVKSGLKVVIDCANGAGSLVTPLLLRELGCKVVTLNAHPDGHFPGRSPEPQPWNLTDLMATVREVNADIGLAHDGDADRIAVVDEQGNFVKPDAIIALFAELAVARASGGKVVTSINTSVAIDEVVTRAGGKVVRTGLGDFTEAMLEHHACFAGEPGKLVFLELGPWADGIFCAAKLLELLSAEQKPISEIISEGVPDYPMYLSDFECPDEIKEEFMRSMRDHLLTSIDEIQEIVEIDGLRVNRRNGSWVLVRPSGTEPKVRFAVEGRDEAERERLKEIGLNKIRELLKL